MKSFIKCLMGIAVSLSLLTCFNGFNVYAKMNQNINEMNQNFVALVDDVFEGNKSIDVVDGIGNSIKFKFIVENKDDFDAGNYGNIERYCLEENASFLRKDKVMALEQFIGGTPRVSSTYNIYYDKPRSFTQNGISVSYVARISGTVRVNESTGEITSYSGPYLSVVSSTLVGTSQLQNVSTSVSWGSSSHRSITMSGSYVYTCTTNASYYPLYFKDSTQTISVSY